MHNTSTNNKGKLQTSPERCEKHINMVSEVKGILKEQKSETGNREVDNKAEMGINSKKSYKTYRKAF